VVVAGGAGVRFGARKQFEVLSGRSVLARSLGAARAACAGVVVVVPRGGERAAEVIEQCAGADAVVAGGDSRSASVRAGLAALPPGAEIVAVHDAARPLAPPEVWDRVIEAVVSGADAAVPVVAVTDTVVEVSPDGGSRTLDRSRLVAVQTPQGFRTAVLVAAHAGDPEATDDAGLVEAVGGRVVLVAGDPANLKITAPADLVVAAALLAAGGDPGGSAGSAERSAAATGAEHLTRAARW
jgi:2-C-methyl-D-erythritol 4-phosphate cytidylyltransferase